MDYPVIVGGFGLIWLYRTFVSIKNGEEDGIGH